MWVTKRPSEKALADYCSFVQLTSILSTNPVRMARNPSHGHPAKVRQWKERQGNVAAGLGSALLEYIVQAKIIGPR